MGIHQLCLAVWQSLEQTGVVIRAGLWETWGMSEKRIKSDKSQRQADKLERKARHPGAKKKKRPSRKSISETHVRDTRKEFVG
jgi:hypothetical protein